jgi:hypothetical protein
MNVCIMLYSIFTCINDLMWFSQQPYEAACYTHIKDENKSQGYVDFQKIPQIMNSCGFSK